MTTYFTKKISLFLFMFITSNALVGMEAEFDCPEDDMTFEEFCNYDNNHVSQLPEIQPLDLQNNDDDFLKKDPFGDDIKEDEDPFCNKLEVEPLFEGDFEEEILRAFTPELSPQRQSSPQVQPPHFTNSDDAIKYLFCYDEHRVWNNFYRCPCCKQIFSLENFAKHFNPRTKQCPISCKQRNKQHHQQRHPNNVVKKRSCEKYYTCNHPGCSARCPSFIELVEHMLAEEHSLWLFFNDKFSKYKVRKNQYQCPLCRQLFQRDVFKKHMLIPHFPPRPHYSKYQPRRKFFLM